MPPPAVPAHILAEAAEYLGVAVHQMDPYVLMRAAFIKLRAVRLVRGVHAATAVVIIEPEPERT